MDCFDVMQVFVCVVDIGSFIKVVEMLYMSCISVIQLVQ